MTTEEYIASGVLESYVMGELSDKEMQKVQCMALVHDDVRAELQKIELTFEQMSLETSETPSKGLKEKIWSEIEVSKPDPSPSAIISMNDGKREESTNRFSFSRAASVAAIIGLGVLSYSLYQQNVEMDERISSIQSEFEGNVAELESERSRLSHLQNDISVFKDPMFTEVKMMGTDNAPKSFAKVYWNASQQEVFLSIGMMTDLPEGKVYQLWALDGGVPVDAGTFLPQENLIKMKSIASSQAFAVTIEDEGGAESPALETLQVIGEISV
ncbi:MAG: anti-sigma factor [Flavobacteriales bacterium]|nr:anti-sigma factor [Flavobacteriales bacterium]NNK80394.1 anti-sigma factor [Flavobacteriales bacterium]